MPERRRSGTGKINTLTSAIVHQALVEERLTPPTRALLVGEKA